MVLAALVGGATGVVAFDLVRATLQLVVLRAVVARADLVAALRLVALAIFTFLVVGVVDQGVAVGTFVGVAVDSVLRHISKKLGNKQTENQLVK